MAKRKTERPQSDRPSAGFIVGRAAFEKISAVEGIVPSAASRARAAAFDRRGLSAKEQRRAIIEAWRTCADDAALAGPAAQVRFLIPPAPSS